MSNSFGEYLKELRGSRSLREVHRATGVSHTYLSTLEKGFDPRTGNVRKPNPDILKRLADYYVTDYEKLMVLARYVDENPKRTALQKENERLKLENESLKTLVTMFNDKTAELNTFTQNMLDTFFDKAPVDKEEDV